MVGATTTATLSCDNYIIPYITSLWVHQLLSFITRLTSVQWVGPLGWMNTLFLNTLIKLNKQRSTN